MTGALWAVGSGVGFGLFQSLNRRALAGMDVALSTFIQLFVSAIVLSIVSLLTEDVGLLASAPVGALVAFGLVGLIHFFVGWTLLNLAQKLIGAARTGPLLATTPLFGAVLAAIWLQEVPGLLTVAGMTLTVTGVLVLSTEREAVVELPAPPEDDEAPAADRAPSIATVTRTRRRAGVLAALGTAFCWALSPIFIREGLEGLPSPLLGVTVSMVASAVVYGVVLGARRAGSATGSTRAPPSASRSSPGSSSASRPGCAGSPWTSRRWRSCSRSTRSPSRPCCCWRRWWSARWC